MSKEKTSVSISPQVMGEVRTWAERTGESVSAFFELAATERCERLRQETDLDEVEAALDFE